MKWLSLAAAALVGMTASANALTFMEAADLPNVASADPVFGAVVLGTLSSGQNLMDGQLGGDCLAGGAVNTCTGGDFQDSFLVDVQAGEAIVGLTITTVSAFGPSGWQIRFVVDSVAGSGSGAALQSTSAFDLNVPKNGQSPVLPGLPLTAGRYDFSVFAFGDDNPPVVGSFDLVWQIEATVEGGVVAPSIPLPPAAAMLAGGIALLGVMRQRRRT